ncbi:MAG: MFS transporter [Clostridia bacterium]|nr:MFS transporter [Clostridia bacterium]
MSKKSKELQPEMLDENGRKPLKLNYPITFRVGFAFAIVMIFWTAYDFVVPLLLENAYGLPNWARGLIMGLDNILSLFMLPIFGKLSDNAKGKIVHKFGRRTPFIVLGTLASVVLMVFVPVVTLNQQKLADQLVYDKVESKITIEYEMETGDNYLGGLLTEWYDKAEKGEQINGEGAANYVDLQYLNMNNISREEFINIRYYPKMTSKKAILGMLGATTYYYDGVAVEDLSAKPDGINATYQEMLDSNDLFKKFVQPGINTYESHLRYTEITMSNSVSGMAGVKSLAVYMVILLLVLIAMATFRSPAVALMPDVTPKPLRSQANAIINLMGGMGGALAFIIYTVVLFGQRLENYVIIFASVAAGMLILLAAFLALVKEKKLVARCQEICKEYGIDDFDEEENSETHKFAEELIEEGEGGGALEREEPKAEKKKRLAPKEWWGSKSKEEKGKLTSFLLILASIFMWFMGYNAISSNLSVYTTKALNLSAGIASIISGVSMGVSAIAFIPVGFLAAKIGRRKSIIIGYGLAVISFILICFAINQGQAGMLKAVLFALFYLIAGFGLIIANVNTFPMVTELSTAETVGQYTGYYYAATMSAQAITPMLGGLVMDYVADRYIFLYSAICIVIAIVLMVFVKHGDSKPVGKGKKLSKEEKKQIMLDSMDSAD